MALHGTRGAGQNLELTVTKVVTEAGRARGVRIEPESRGVDIRASREHESRSDANLFLGFANSDDLLTQATSSLFCACVGVGEPNTKSGFYVVHHLRALPLRELVPQIPAAPQVEGSAAHEAKTTKRAHEDVEDKRPP